MKKFIGAALAALSLFCLPAFAQTQQPPFARVDGDYIASRYSWDVGQVRTTNAVAAGTATIILNASTVTLRDGSVLNPFAITAPIRIDAGTSVDETLIPTAVSGCGSNAPNATCAVTGVFANAHGPSAAVTSGTFGLSEAMNDASGFNGAGLTSQQGSIVVVDKSWTGTTAQIAGTAASGSNVVALPNVIIMDKRNGPVVFWSLQATAPTILGIPATLVAGTAGITVNGANATGGLYTNAAAYQVSIAYVDIMGQEGQGSVAFALTPGSGTTNQIGFTAPAASAGAVGYEIYISLTNGTAQLEYKVPLVTQPATVGAYPVSNGVCTLTTMEYTTPACALTNATYGEVGSGAVVSALTLSTSPIVPVITIVSTTSVYVPNPGGRITYSYVPGSHIGLPGLVAAAPAFTITTGALTIVPNVLGTINIPPGFMNYVGRTIEICGYATTTASAATIVDIQFQWDSIGANTAGKGVLIGEMTSTPVAPIATAGHASFCEDFQTTATGATATGGSIETAGGSGSAGGILLLAPGALSNTVTWPPMPVSTSSISTPRQPMAPAGSSRTSQPKSSINARCRRHPASRRRRDCRRRDNAEETPLVEAARGRIAQGETTCSSGSREDSKART
jgi:hypothetical protein